MRKIIFELCAETVDACLAARDGGAHRIELCSGLSEGGLTPSHGLVWEAIRQSGLPIHVLIRPRSGDFLYSDSELAVMREDILHMKQLGAAGVVLGVLRPDDTVDIDSTRDFVRLARPMKVTFHRAFDATPSLSHALEDVVAAGCDRVLTSGGEADVIAGVVPLAELVILAKGRIEIAVGGGLRLGNAATLSRLSGAEHFHGSLRPCLPAQPPSAAVAVDAAGNPDASGTRYVVDAGTVRTMIQQLKNYEQ